MAEPTLPGPEHVDPVRAKGPVSSGSELARVARELAAVQAIVAGGDVDGAAVVLNAGILVVGEAICLGPTDGGNWVVLFAHAGDDDVKVFRLSARHLRQSGAANPEESKQ